ncbi:hypothetical protein [Streptomyces sp. NBC_01744]|uniref:hypothetical protein n=1 Tax=Streptomyces sp. NBC_01744 TaxID=2975927 RepID=UPI003D9A9D3A|nr:hypothetical protein OIE70_36315 [Streptomyces sp. NBC_01744]
MTTAPDQQPVQVGQPPTIIINNGSSAAASALAVVGGYGRLGRRRQSFWAHFWLFMFTAGIGNGFYALHVSRWNRARGL